MKGLRFFFGPKSTAILYLPFSGHHPKLMDRICLFPGTFDPITMGHVDVIRRAAPLFDRLVVGIGINSSKQPMFPTEQRIAWIEEIFRDDPRVAVQSYSGLTLDCCREIG